MAHLTNFSFEFFYKIFTEDASLLLYHDAKKSKMTKNSNQGGGVLLHYVEQFTSTERGDFVASERLKRASEHQSTFANCSWDRSRCNQGQKKTS